MSIEQLKAAMNVAYTSARLEPGRGGLIEYINILEQLLVRSMLEAKFTAQEATTCIQLGVAKLNGTD